MSYWTYINGVITLDCMGETQPQIEYILKSVLNHLPIVTGSERDMDIHIVKRNGTNHSSSQDEFGEVTNNLTDWYGDRDRKSGWLRTQTTYFLLVDGCLRDRMFDETYREFQNWLCRLAKRIFVDDVFVKISAYEKEAIVTNKNDCYGKMREWPSWCKKESDGEPAWYEYLLPVRAKNSVLPALIEYKYFNNEENDEFVEKLLEK